MDLFRIDDLAGVIREGCVGYAVEGDSIAQLQQAAERLADHADALAAMGEAGRRLAKRLFSPAVAARQVVGALARTKTP
jgi:glycosyltransferase involved in cell wall biosynthesis